MLFIPKFTSTSGLRYETQSGNREFPLSTFLEAFNETVEFIKENCGKYWGDGKALADALKAEILQHVQDDKARLSTLAVLSTIFDPHEVKNVEMENLGFHNSFHSKDEKVGGKGNEPELLERLIQDNNPIPAPFKNSENTQSQKVEPAKLYRCKTCKCDKCDEDLWRLRTKTTVRPLSSLAH